MGMLAKKKKNITHIPNFDYVPQIKEVKTEPQVGVSAAAWSLKCDWMQRCLDLV